MLYSESELSLIHLGQVLERGASEIIGVGKLTAQIKFDVNLLQHEIALVVLSSKLNGSLDSVPPYLQQGYGSLSSVMSAHGANMPLL